MAEQTEQVYEWDVARIGDESPEYVYEVTRKTSPTIAAPYVTRTPSMSTTGRPEGRDCPAQWLRQP